ncbi:WAT1-related protein At4g15540-like isoform X1 [Silene latifolia]|uniref:WAT1-related protein At4g15540-like isoform X1 n=2 Tax=Silene latifolia TaxID=37657 RepID=UPI003D784C52
MEGGYLYKDVLPFVLMVALECANVGVNTVFKAATNNGMSYYVFVVYSYSIAAFILFPSNFLCRRPLLPPLTSTIIAKLFLLSLIGAACLLSGYKGIEYGSPTLASAMSNLIPAFTFILAILFRMEKLVWRSSSSQVKIIGTLVSIAGALVIIFYKGPSILMSAPKLSATSINFLHSSNSKWIFGGLLLGGDYILTPVWYIVQAKIIKEYPAELVVVFYYSFFAAIITGAISSVTEPDRAAWILKPDISLAAILYSGLLDSFLSNTIHTYILRRKGPFYIAMFKPLSIAIAAGMGVIFLGDTLYLGSIIGSVVISLGFYAVMWGKATEEICTDFRSEDLESSSQKEPLLASSKPESLSSS